MNTDIDSGRIAGSDNTAAPVIGAGRRLGHCNMSGLVACIAAAVADRCQHDKVDIAIQGHWSELRVHLEQ